VGGEINGGGGGGMCRKAGVADRRIGGWVGSGGKMTSIWKQEGGGARGGGGGGGRGREGKGRVGWGGGGGGGGHGGKGSGVGVAEGERPAVRAAGGLCGGGAAARGAARGAARKDDSVPIDGGCTGTAMSAMSVAAVLGIFGSGAVDFVLVELTCTRTRRVSSG
jgi:hypothetical protein